MQKESSGKMKIQVVIGANYGDEGKGLVSGCLSREASLFHENILTVFYNGTSQRAHTFEGQVFRSMAAGTRYGSDTFYHKKFVVDPISILIVFAKPIIDPDCRVILPCDVINNRMKENERGADRHGSCGFGLFEAVKRSKDPEYDIRIKDFVGPADKLLKKFSAIAKKYGDFDDELYNERTLALARDYIRTKCKIRTLPQLLTEKSYDRIIFEGGQGLMLGQNNTSDFPHLTPSNPGSDYIFEDISRIQKDKRPELFYVSRSYITRHGAGPIEDECTKEDINPEIKDNTNRENAFQGSLRFGRINTESLHTRIQKDISLYREVKPKVNLVFTHLNYTNGKLQTMNGPKDIYIPNFVDDVYASDQKDYMEIFKTHD